MRPPRRGPPVRARPRAGGCRTTPTTSPGQEGPGGGRRATTRGVELPVVKLTGCAGDANTLDTGRPTSRGGVWERRAWRRLGLATWEPPRPGRTPSASSTRPDLPAVTVHAAADAPPGEGDGPRVRGVCVRPRPGSLGHGLSPPGPLRDCAGMDRDRIWHRRDWTSRRRDPTLRRRDWAWHRRDGIPHRVDGAWRRRDGALRLRDRSGAPCAAPCRGRDPA